MTDTISGMVDYIVSDPERLGLEPDAKGDPALLRGLMRRWPAATPGQIGVAVKTANVRTQAYQALADYCDAKWWPPRATEGPNYAEPESRAFIIENMARAMQIHQGGADERRAEYRELARIAIQWLTPLKGDPFDAEIASAVSQQIEGDHRALEIVQAWCKEVLK